MAADDGAADLTVTLIQIRFGAEVPAGAAVPEKKSEESAAVKPPAPPDEKKTEEPKPAAKKDDPAKLPTEPPKAPAE